MVVNRDFSAHAEFYQAIFEIGRRHKIMVCPKQKKRNILINFSLLSSFLFATKNPEKMRTEYGKLIYLLQDSMTPEIQDLIKFSMVHPVLTVYPCLISYTSPLSLLCFSHLSLLSFPLPQFELITL